MFAGGFALVFVAVSIALFSSRDVAPVFGHLDPSRRGAAPVRRAAAVFALAALVLPGTAWAHATLLTTAPGSASGSPSRRAS